jgi:hypothetical protein
MIKLYESMVLNSGMEVNDNDNSNGGYINAAFQIYLTGLCKGMKNINQYSRSTQAFKAGDAPINEGHLKTQISSEPFRIYLVYIIRSGSFM